MSCVSSFQRFLQRVSYAAAVACRDNLLASLAPAGLRPETTPGPAPGAAPGGAVVWYLVEAFYGPGAEVWVVLDPSAPTLKQALGALDKRAAAAATAAAAAIAAAAAAAAAAAQPPYPATEPWEPPPPTSPPPPLPTPPDDAPPHVLGPAVPTNVAYL